MNFQIGDRVTCVVNRGETALVYGDTGTVWSIGDKTWTETTRIGVEWDNLMDGHYIDPWNQCKRNHGWWVNSDTLQLITPEIEDEDFVLDADLL